MLALVACGEPDPEPQAPDNRPTPEQPTVNDPPSGNETNDNEEPQAENLDNTETHVPEFYVPAPFETHASDREYFYVLSDDYIIGMNTGVSHFYSALSFIDGVCVNICEKQVFDSEETAQLFYSQDSNITLVNNVAYFPVTNDKFYIGMTKSDILDKWATWEHIYISKDTTDEPTTQPLDTPPATDTPTITTQPPANTTTNPPATNTTPPPTTPTPPTQIETVIINGTEYNINITTINLSQVYGSPLAPLSLTNEQMNSLKPFTKLKRINANSSDGKITDISVLAGMTDLIELNLNDNNISDLSPLSNLTKIDYLSLYNNSISDISALKNLTNIDVLNLSYNNISDISALSNMSNLRSLNLQYCQISDISALRNLTGLRYLYLEGNPLSEQAIKDLQNALPNCEIYF